MKRHHTILILATAALLWLVGLPVLADEGGSVHFGEQVTLEDGQAESGDLVLFGGDVEMQAGSRVEGDVVVVGGNADIAGEIAGSVSVIGGTLSLEQTAVVYGDAAVAGTLRFRHPDAVVMGNVVEGSESSVDWAQIAGDLPTWIQPNWGAGTAEPAPQATPQTGSGAGLIAFTILAVAVAALAMAVVPDNVTNARQIMLTSAPLSIGVGLLTLLAAVVLVPLLICICIGIPVAAVLAIAVLLCMALAWVAAGNIVGERVLGWFKATKTPMGQTLLGVLIISLLAGIPCIGQVAALIAVSWGLGAVVLSRFGTRVDPIWSLSRTEDAKSVVDATPVTPRESVEQAPPAGEASVSETPADGGDTHELDITRLDELERDANDELDKL